MLKKYKQFIIGLLLGSLIFSATPALAENMKIDVMFDNLKIKINGKLVNIEEEPFIYKGKTYVPLRAVAELLNKQVEYNSNNNEIMIDDKSVVDNKKIEEPESTNQLETIKKTVYWNGNKIITETNLPENAVVTDTKYGVKYNNENYIYTWNLLDKLHFKLTSDEENMYYKASTGEVVTISYEDANSPEVRIVKGGGTAYFVNANLFKELLPKEYLK